MLVFNFKKLSRITHSQIILLLIKHSIFSHQEALLLLHPLHRILLLLWIFLHWSTWTPPWRQLPRPPEKNLKEILKFRNFCFFEFFIPCLTIINEGPFEREMTTMNTANLKETYNDNDTLEKTLFLSI